MEGWTIWETVGSVFGIFSNVGNTVVTGSDPKAQPLFDTGTLTYLGEQTPLVARILSEVKTGWSMQTILDFWGPLLQIPILVTLVFGTSMLYCAIRVYQIRQIEKVNLQLPEHAEDEHETPRLQARWHRVLESVSSDDPQRWRNGILEADFLLNELLDTLGFKGETMGDKMRQADVTVFKTIDFAWEAHQVRNHIAQDPQFSIDAREAKRVIKMYERVFEEFHFLGGEEHSH